MRFNLYSLVCIITCLVACSEDSSVGGESGMGGSLTRFAISYPYLYVATGSNISVYSVAENDFQAITELPIGFGLETIQVSGNFLYLGARDAMYIYSIANRASPQFVFRYSHIVSCDPVVVQGNRAYVTLKSGNPCNFGVNTLEIIDITDPYNPTLLTQYNMTSPGGLGISGECLFVCEGVHGLKMFNVANDKITLLTSLDDVNAYDVIVQPDHVTLTGEDGIFQYHYSCDNPSIALISKIPVLRVEF